MDHTRTFTDTFNDDMRIRLDGPKLHIKATQKFPLPVSTGETSVESVGEMTSITTSGGSIVINATGNVIINPK